MSSVAVLYTAQRFLAPKSKTLLGHRNNPAWLPRMPRHSWTHMVQISFFFLFFSYVRGCKPCGVCPSFPLERHAQCSQNKQPPDRTLVNAPKLANSARWLVATHHPPTKNSRPVLNLRCEVHPASLFSSTSSFSPTPILRPTAHLPSPPAPPFVSSSPSVPLTASKSGLPA